MAKESPNTGYWAPENWEPRPEDFETPEEWELYDATRRESAVAMGLDPDTPGVEIQRLRDARSLGLSIDATTPEIIQASVRQERIQMARLVGLPDDARSADVNSAFRKWCEENDFGGLEREDIEGWLE